MALSFPEQTSSWGWIWSATRFFRRHFALILFLGLIAGFGRAIQLKAFGPISGSFHILLEVVIETARILIFLYALGLSNVKAGLRRLRYVFSRWSVLKENTRTGWQQLKLHWKKVVASMVVFMLMAAATNYLIDALAYQTCLLAHLKAGDIVSENASEWVILLFFKNISVIPFTLVFNAVFLLWITKKLRPVLPGHQLSER